MKSWITITILMAFSFPIFALDEQTVGTSKYLELHTRTPNDLTVAVAEDDTVHLRTQSYDYLLTPSEKNLLASFLGEGVRLIDVASGNKTTIDFRKTIGEVPMSISSGSIVVDFRTSGWQASDAMLTLKNGGLNLVLLLDVNQATSLLSNLNKAAAAGGDIKKQQRLFQ